MVDAGIISKLYNDFLYDVTVLEHIRQHDPDLEESLTVLTLGHMDGAFTVFLLGIIISSVVFLVELCIGFYAERRRSKRLWKLLKNSWRQVSIMRQSKKKRKNDKWKMAIKPKKMVKVKSSLNMF